MGGGRAKSLGCTLIAVLAGCGHDSEPSTLRLRWFAESSEVLVGRATTVTLEARSPSSPICVRLDVEGSATLAPLSMEVDGGSVESSLGPQGGYSWIYGARHWTLRVLDTGDIYLHALSVPPSRCGASLDGGTGSSPVTLPTEAVPLHILGVRERTSDNDPSAPVLDAGESSP